MHFTAQKSAKITEDYCKNALAYLQENNSFKETGHELNEGPICRKNSQVTKNQSTYALLPILFHITHIISIKFNLFSFKLIIYLFFYLFFLLFSGFLHLLFALFFLVDVEAAVSILSLNSQFNCNL